MICSLNKQNETIRLNTKTSEICRGRAKEKFCVLIINIHKIFPVMKIIRARIKSGFLKFDIRSDKNIISSPFQTNLPLNVYFIKVLDITVTNAHRILIYMVLIYALGFHKE